VLGYEHGETVARDRLLARVRQEPVDARTF
jgi:hypothetical protein